jgi:hypothetical protein
MPKVKRAFGFGAAMVDVFHRQVEFILMGLKVATILCAPVSQHPQEA